MVTVSSRCGSGPSPRPSPTGSRANRGGYHEVSRGRGHARARPRLRHGRGPLAARQRARRARATSARGRAGSGRVAVVEGPPGVGKSSLPRAVARAASESGMRVLRAWAGPLEQQAGWGIARQLFGRGAAGAGSGSASTSAPRPRQTRPRPRSGRAGPDRRRDARGVVRPDLPGHRAGRADADRDGRRRRALGRRPSLRWLVQLTRQLPDLHLGVLCAVRSGEPSVAPALLDELLAAAPEPPVRPRPLGPDAVESIVAERLPGAGRRSRRVPRGQRRQPVPARRADRRAARARGRADRRGRRPVDDLRPRAGRPHRGAPALPSPGRRGGAGARVRRPGSRSAASPGRSLAELDVADAELLADRLAAIGILGGRGDGRALTHPLVESALYRSLPAGERSLLHRRAADLLAAEQADVEAVGLHLVHAEPAADPQTVTRLHAAAERAIVAVRPSRRDLPAACPGEPPGARARRGPPLRARARAGGSGATRGAAPCARPSRSRYARAAAADRPVGEPSPRAGRPLRRRHRDRAQGWPSRATRRTLRGQLELEMVCSMMLAADTVEEGYERVRAHRRPGARQLWRILWRGSARRRLPRGEVASSWSRPSMP